MSSPPDPTLPPTPQHTPPHQPPHISPDVAVRPLLQRLQRLKPHAAGTRWGLVAAILAAAFASATEPMIPALLKPLLDRGFSGGDLPIWAVPAALVALFAVRGAAGFLAQYALAWTTNRVVVNLRAVLFARLLDGPAAMFRGQSASALTNTVVYEVQQGANLLGGALLGALKDGLTILALLGYLLFLNWKLTLMVLLLAPAVAAVMRVVSKRLRKLAVAGQDATDELAYVVEENVLAWRIVRLHGAQASQQSRFDERSQRLRRLMLKAVAAGASSSPITQLLAAVALSGVIMAALWQTGSGAAPGTGAPTVGSFVAFVTAMLLLVAPLKHLSDVAAPLVRGLAALERGLDLLETHPAEQGGAHRLPAGGRARGELSFEAVGLRYREDAQPALDGIELRVAAGEVLALVGPSGAGKSSLVQLLPRFVEPTTGRIQLDGVDLAAWDLQTLRRQIAYVSQEVVLFNDTVAANIALGDELSDLTVQQRLRAALEHAHLAAFVDSLPQGVNTPVGHNGSQLSGGQRQRLAIARALYKDAPLLILDEATSALDSESERAVQDALDTLMQGRTTIVIAHRLATIEHAHRVAVLDQGRLVECGSHAELLAQQGLYGRLHALQFKT